MSAAFVTEKMGVVPVVPVMMALGNGSFVDVREVRAVRVGSMPDVFAGSVVVEYGEKSSITVYCEGRTSAMELAERLAGHVDRALTELHIQRMREVGA